jgi:RimJ/RimL family protein N-acetyltransferase
VPDYGRNRELKRALEELPRVSSIHRIRLKKNLVEYVSLGTESAGEVEVRRLQVKDAPALHEFYAEGLSERARRLFAPYPLFHTPPSGANELACRIKKWEKEDDWTATNLSKEGMIIGFGLLKRFKSEQATSGIAVRNDFLNKGLGCLLQKIIVEQARMLGLRRFHVKIVSDNLASVKIHEKCGFRKTGILPSALYPEIFAYLSDQDRASGKKPMDRHLVKMVVDLS